MPRTAATTSSSGDAGGPGGAAAPTSRAAARRSSRPSGWRRFAWLGARPSGWRLLVPVVALAAGVMFSMSFQAARGTDLRSDRSLPELVAAGNRAVADTSERIKAVQGELDVLTAAQAGDTTVAALTTRADALAPIVGTQSVRGPALTVALDDAETKLGNLPPNITPDDIVVHQQDVQAVVNALWRGAADAMMIQDQRVIATSAVRCVGNTLILQGRVYSPPFVISAIGDVRRMRAELEADPQVAIYQQWVDAVGLGYEVTTNDRAEFPAYSGSVAQQFASVVP